MPHAEYEVYGPRSNATTSSARSRRFAALAALIPAASPPTIARRRAIVAPTLPAAGHSSLGLPRRSIFGRPAVGASAFGKLPRHGRRRLTSLANTPWMTEAVDALARELRSHHAPTADHSHRLATLARHVAERLPRRWAPATLARHVAERLALDAIEATEVELVAVLHDVGKLTIDPHLLDWEGPLDETQRARIRRHTIAGEERLTEIAGLEHLANLVGATHEAWDGSGYPDGLRAERIPLTARIVSAADSFDAMTSDRAYRTALPRREACRRLRTGAGAQFDPHVVDALLRVVGCGPLRRS